MIEELRVSLFAQLLGTSGPVSERRIERPWTGCTASRQAGIKFPLAVRQ